MRAWGREHRAILIESDRERVSPREASNLPPQSSCCTCCEFMNPIRSVGLVLLATPLPRLAPPVRALSPALELETVRYFARGNAVKFKKSFRPIGFDCPWPDFEVNCFRVGGPCRRSATPESKGHTKKLCGEKGPGNGLIYVVSFILGKILNERILFFYVLVVQQRKIPSLLSGERGLKIWSRELI